MLDLGLTEYKKLVQSDENYAFINSEEPFLNWRCDWMVTNLLGSISPLYDASMYRFYAEHFNIDVESETDEELNELANLYKKQIDILIVKRMKALVDRIVARYRKFVEHEWTMPRCPSSSKKALSNLLMLVKNTTGTDLTPTFNNFYNTLSEANAPKTTFNYDLSRFGEVISKDLFLQYLDLCERMINKIFTITEDFEFTKFMYGFKYVQQVLKSILLLCRMEVERTAFGVEDMDKIQRRFLDYKCGNIGLNNHRSIPMVYALFINPENIKYVPEDADSYPITDASRLLSVLLYQNLKLSKGNKDV